MLGLNTLKTFNGPNQLNNFERRWNNALLHQYFTMSPRSTWYIYVVLGSIFDRSAWVQTQPIVLEKSADGNRLVTKFKIKFIETKPILCVSLFMQFPTLALS